MPDNESFNLMLDPSIFLDEEMGEESLVARRMEHVDQLVEEGVAVYIPDTIMRATSPSVQEIGPYEYSIFERFYEIDFYVGQAVLARLRAGTIQTYLPEIGNDDHWADAYKHDLAKAVGSIVEASTSDVGLLTDTLFEE